MSGVVDKYGQWEHCDVCGEFELIQHLHYEKKSSQYTYGRDICRKCMLIQHITEEYKRTNPSETLLAFSTADLSTLKSLFYWLKKQPNGVTD